jgi:cytochrome c biogenesis protein CcmG/thiol:disulfide interchange protein DsbE
VVAGVVALVLAGLVALFALSPTQAERRDSAPLVGKVAPAIDARTTADQRFRLDDYRGGWVLVNFFATWCAPCKAELPELSKFVQDHPSGASVVSVSFDENDRAKAISDFFASAEATWPVIAEGNGSIALDYGVIKLPESYLVAPNGRVVLKINGGVQAAQLESFISKAEGS